jgi:hypothetical protein
MTSAPPSLWPESLGLLVVGEPHFGLVEPTRVFLHDCLGCGDAVVRMALTPAGGPRSLSGAQLQACMRYAGFSLLCMHRVDVHCACSPTPLGCRAHEEIVRTLVTLGLPEASEEHNAPTGPPFMIVPIVLSPASSHHLGFWDSTVEMDWRAIEALADRSLWAELARPGGADLVTYRRQSSRPRTLEEPGRVIVPLYAPHRRYMFIGWDPELTLESTVDGPRRHPGIRTYNDYFLHRFQIQLDDPYQHLAITAMPPSRIVDCFKPHKGDADHKKLVRTHSRTHVARTHSLTRIPSNTHTFLSLPLSPGLCFFRSLSLSLSLRSSCASVEVLLQPRSLTQTSPWRTPITISS